MKVKITYSLLFVFLIIIYSCSSSTSKDVLNFLFDGIPQSDSSITQSGYEILKDSTVNLSERKKLIVPKFFYHMPYEENFCESCHDINSSYKKIMSLPELCYNCHDNFQSTYKNVHYPIESGECNACHHPHQAKFAQLLLKPVRELCTDCHDLDELLAGDMHSSIEDTDCTDCHDPHGSNDSSLMR